MRVSACGKGEQCFNPPVSKSGEVMQKEGIGVTALEEPVHGNHAKRRDGRQIDGETESRFDITTVDPP